MGEVSLWRCGGVTPRSGALLQVSRFGAKRIDAVIYNQAGELFTLKYKIDFGVRFVMRQSRHGTSRLAHNQKSTCITRLTLGPYVCKYGHVTLKI